ncbi:unnamed protein product [Chilo suppressalis]|uniref:Translation initiation factor eIF2B subunit beta n=1 Tax=Chilo suppressalis TaxID=168631 RepID=A0ABN8B7U2_CHISP|nr:unnamed protein product [Chilo suppressalis]
MAPSESPPRELDSKHEDKIVKFVSDIRNGKIEGSNNIALTTLSLLEQIITECENATALELSGVVREVGRRLCRALPQELVAANMARRVLRAIRDEHRLLCEQSGGATSGTGTGTEGSGDSLQRLVLAAHGGRRTTLGAALPHLREPLRDHIAEVRAEIESCTASISSQARAHVHAAELILTHGASSLTERFLKAARRHTHYRLLLGEGPRVQESHAMAARLSAAGVPVTLINDASIAAVMSRVNKVVIGVRAVLAGGALLARAGTHGLTIAAKHYSVPVIALCPLYKLSPLHACDRYALSALDCPRPSMLYECGESSRVHVECPRYDVVPPDHVTLFLTNLGGSSPSYIYRLLSELYDPKDHQL